MTLCEEKIYIRCVSYAVGIFVSRGYSCTCFFPEEGTMTIWLAADEPGCMNAFMNSVSM